MPPIDALQVVPPATGPALTPSQKRFNTLIRQIEQARQNLAAWNEGTGAYRQAHAEVLEPLRAELLAGHRRWVLALEAALDQRNWTKAECGTLRELLCEAAGELLDARGRLMVAAAALVITVATWFATPDSFIFFGILHQIALASLLGLAFVNLPALVTLAVAGLVITAAFFMQADIFNHPLLWWVGLSTSAPRSNDSAVTQAVHSVARPMRCAEGDVPTQ